MYSRLNYVISRQINLLILGPSYLRWSILLIVATVLSVILINLFITEVRDESKQLDSQISEINAQLTRYEQQRDLINHDYERLMASSRLMAKLEEQFSRVNSLAVESWLIDTAVNNDLHPSQIDIDMQVSDDHGEFYKITFKISGIRQNMQKFLENIIRSDYFLIRENLIFEFSESNQLSLTIALKQYLDIHDENPVSG